MESPRLVIRESRSVLTEGLRLLILERSPVPVQVGYGTPKGPGTNGCRIDLQQTDRWMYIVHDWDAAEDIRAVLAAGVWSLVSLTDTLDYFVRAVTALLQGNTHDVPISVLSHLQPHQGVERRGTVESASILTARERDVLRLVIEGLSNPQIAERLFISTNTVRTHIASISAKLETNNRVHMVRRARELGLDGDEATG